MKKVFRFISFILIDQGIKLVISYLTYIPAIGNAIHFDISGNLKLKQCNIIVLFLYGFCLIANYIIFRKNENIKEGLFFVILGACSNVFDMVFRGYVLDWIKIYNLNFNIADIYIFYGTLRILRIFNINTFIRLVMK